MEPIEATGARIAALPTNVINQIAAGEVIERPASVVKEMVENAIDAGATRIRIDLEEGGVKLVRVVDDGCGMSASDLKLVFAPHATSKLFTPEDLDHIASLGFRGEAMASIGSIARCRVVSRQAGSDLAVGIENQGGQIGEVTDEGGSFGTTIEVRDLFFNTPARRRFLKRTSTELSRCLDVIQRLALAHEGVGFVATHDGRRLFDVEPEMGLRDRIRRTFGAELADSLVPVKLEEPGYGGLVLTGFVAPPRFSRRDTSRLMWFLNGRFLRDKLLHRVLKEGYRGFLIEQRQPVAFLQISMDPALVDVNVHPQKSEVRFREGRKLFGVLVRALREAVAMTDIATPGAALVDRVLKRESGEEQPGQSWLTDPGKLGGGGSVPEVRPWNPPEARPSSADGTSSYPLEALPGSSTTSQPGNTDLGGLDSGHIAANEADATIWKTHDEIRGPYIQVDKTYIMRATPDGFEVIDQHALHERLTYELLLRDLYSGAIEIQRLLVPELIELSKSEVELVSTHVESLKKLGVDIAVFGPSTVAVHGLPARIKRPDIDGLINDILHTIEERGTTPTADEVVEEVLHRMACRSSVMAGDTLSQDEIHSLLTRARELGCDQTCPHARPTRVRFTIPDLERAFHRK